MKADLPEAANFRLKQLSALFAWALKNDLVATNPAEKVEKLKSGSDGFYTWTDDDEDAFEAHWPVGSKPRLAMAIMLYLGVRRSDAVRIGKKHESRDGLFVTFSQFKGRENGAKVLTLPILPPLRAVLDASALGAETWLETAYGKPHSAAGFGNIFREWCREAGLPQCSPHGLRKIGAVRAVEAGASEHTDGDVRLGRRQYGADLHPQGRAKEARRKRRSQAVPGEHCPTLCPTQEEG